MTRADGLYSLELESFRLFGLPLEAEQIDCYMAGREDALGMLDDMESRMGFRVQTAREAL
jgi:hypothetical protein